jgi:hypothetical protein
MKKILSHVVVPFLLLACADQPPQSAEEIKPFVITDACYAYTTNKDTVILQISVSDTLVSGTLEYKLYEKDRNKGTIRGSMKGDTLYADYLFFSEGMESTREVVFLKKDNMLTEGYGERDEINGRMVFKNKTQLDFSGILILKKIDCKK